MFPLAGTQTLPSLIVVGTSSGWPGVISSRLAWDRSLGIIGSLVLDLADVGVAHTDRIGQSAGSGESRFRPLIVKGEPKMCSRVHFGKGVERRGFSDERFLGNNPTKHDSARD